MRKSVVAISPRETVAAASKRMREHDLGALLLLEDDRPVGIFSERDLVKRVVAEGLDPATTLVRDVATASPLTVKEDADVLSCYQLIREQGFRHLPVVDAAGHAVGMISVRDFLEHMVLRMQDRVNVMELYRDIAVMELNVYGN